MVHFRLKAILILFLLIAAIPAHAQTPIPTPTRLQFDGDQALLTAAAQVAFGFRPTGSAAGAKTADYIRDTLTGYGWQATEQPFDLSINGQTVHGRNIIGTLGSGPVIIFGAHFDTRLWADNDPDAARRHDPVLGADDGASGVSVMLELARVLAHGYTLSREIRLVFLDAEDNGNIPGWNDFSLGTYYYVAHLDVTPDYVVILDMVGDAALNIYYEGASMQSAPDVMKGIWRAASELGFADNFIPSMGYTMIDDHTPFIRAGMRAVDIIDFDYPYWHTVNDSLDKISARSMEKVGRTLQLYLEQTHVTQ